LLVDHGIRPILVDEAPRIGGQIYRLPPNAGGFRRSAHELYGTEAEKAHALFKSFERIHDKVDYLPNCLVYDIDGNRAQIYGNNTAESIDFDALVLATGAMDRILPFRGWTLPGIYSLGGAQIALKHQGCAIGGSIVFAGTGPLLFLVAYQYAKAGAQIAAVVNSAPRGAMLSQALNLAALPRVALKGMQHLRWLKQQKIRVLHGWRPLAAHGDERLNMLEFVSERGDTLEVDCDAAAFGYGLKPETQLADLAGAHFSFDTLNRQWLPMTDAYGRATDRPGLYLAGDGAGILGADAAELRGRLAAAAVLSDRGRNFDGFDPNAALQELQKWQRFRHALEQAFPFPHETAAEIDDDVILCRCEAVTAGDFRGVCGQLGARELNRAKAYCRLGMGRCQGRLCGPAAAEIMATHLGVSIDSVGRLRGQPPIKPVPVAALAASMPLPAAQPSPVSSQPETTTTDDAPVETAPVETAP
jgi:NADPH-dependent 2,4-dienoyl-CoA reductase/sulfur reductase-like enzyme